MVTLETALDVGVPWFGVWRVVPPRQRFAACVLTEA